VCLVDAEAQADETANNVDQSDLKDLPKSSTNENNSEG
jgi:hypothetical protein